MKWLIVLSMTLMLLACERQGSLERAGEEIDEAFEDVKAGGETTGNKIDDAVDDAQSDIEDMVEKD